MICTFPHKNPGPDANERRRFRFVLLWLLALYALIFVIACGGPEKNPLTATETPAPPAPRVIRQGTIPLEAPSDDAFQFFLVPITDSSPGRWEATVDWSNDANTLWMWVADGVCSVQQFTSDPCPFEVDCPCRFAIRSETATPKPRVLTIPSAAGGTRTLIIGNLGPHAETVQYRVTVTASASAATTTTGDGAQTANATPVSTALKIRRSDK